MILRGFMNNFRLNYRHEYSNRLDLTLEQSQYYFRLDKAFTWEMDSYNCSYDLYALISVAKLKRP